MKMLKTSRAAGYAVVVVVAALLAAGRSVAAADHAEDDRLSFQTSPGWSPRVNLNADVAMVYGIDASLPRRMQTWRDRGYHVWVMTGVAWGEYQDYLSGKFDGKNHEDEEQTNAAGEPRGHGGGIYYMSPSQSYGKYLSVGVLRALDAGAEAVCLEEPEFWVSSGWEANFHKQWKSHYKENWQPPDASADAQYRASKLKYALYREALAQVFAAVHQYGKEHHRQIPCYVATHSLINYAHWKIVSPESSLIDVGCDGYIAQVWTGTSRTPNVYQGRLRERTFETAFLEYGAMQNLVRASGRKVWYLNDPVEDNPNHTWADYQGNWQNTLIASLFQPEVWRYEIMPWPQRIFRGRYRDQSGRRVGISRGYETELQAVISALADMKQPASSVGWQSCGTQGVGVLVSDTMMFQRGSAQASDEHLGSFYGLALPLLMHGVPVEPVQIESATAPGFLDRYKMLVLTYEGQKPPTPQFHDALARWVRNGGALLVVDDDRDPFDSVREWWNEAPMSFKSPRQHLFKTLGLPPDAAGVSHVGKGVVCFKRVSPASLSYARDGADRLRALAMEAAKATRLSWKESDALVLRRGPYVVVAGLDDSVANLPPTVLRGRFVDLFDPAMTLTRSLEIKPGTRALLVDLDRLESGPAIVGAACRVRDWTVTPEMIRFRADGIADTDAVLCIQLDRAPASVRVNDKPLQGEQVRYGDGLLRITFPNSCDTQTVEIARAPAGR